MTAQTRPTDDPLDGQILSLWKGSRGHARQALWKRRVLPRLGQALARRHPDGQTRMWDDVQRDEAMDMLRPPYLATTLAYTATFPFDPRWMSSRTWPVAVATARAWAEQVPWDSPTTPSPGWSPCPASAGHVFAFLMEDKDAPDTLPARFLERLVEAGIDLDPLAPSVEISLVKSIADGTTDPLPYLLAHGKTTPLLAALARNAAQRPNALHPRFLIIALACWAHGIVYGDAGTAIWLGDGMLALSDLSAHRRLEAVAWSKAQGWPLRATSDGCIALARSLADGTPI